MDQANELTGILNSMGETADAVAATLRAASTKGVRNTVRFLNPVIRYCQVRLRHEEYALDLIQQDILRMLLPNGRKVEVRLPQPVKDYLDAFHRGQFPDLELPS